MSMKTSLITYLNAQAALTDLVGDRISFAYAEQGAALPYIVIFQISGVHEHHMTAASGKVIARFQINVYGATVLSALATSEAVRQELDGFSGTMGDVFVSVCHLESERDNTDIPLEGAHLGIESVQQDYMIGWTVSVPTF